MDEQPNRPEGTWFYTWAGEDVYHLWQQTDAGPKRCGIIYNHPSVDFICERLNEPFGSFINRQQA